MSIRACKKPTVAELKSAWKDLETAYDKALKTVVSVSKAISDIKSVCDDFPIRGGVGEITDLKTMAELKESLSSLSVMLQTEIIPKLNDASFALKYTIPKL